MFGKLKTFSLSRNRVKYYVTTGILSLNYSYHMRQFKVDYIITILV